MRIVVLAASLAIAGCASQAEPRSRPVGLGNVRREIVAASIYGYEINTKGSCPCPYSKDGACKGVSAYDRPGGAKPKCFKANVKAEDVKRWRELLRNSAAR